MTDQIYLHNSDTNQIEKFEPKDSTRVQMYVCGPTVYDRVHIGNARSAVVFDLLWMLLRTRYSRVVYVRNFTDIDDKIIVRAAESGISPQTLANQAIEWYYNDIDALGVERPSHEPKVSEHIEIIKFDIQTMIDLNDAYVTDDGHVYFRTGADVDERYARIIHSAGKEAQGDFVLWKPAKQGEPGWIADFGAGPMMGRPGWHIECTSMATAFLGHGFDIHGGGSDLKFPHHHNECLQARSIAKITGEDQLPFARYWMHNGMLTVNGEKMSKSLGNFVTVRDLLDRGVPGPVIRMALLSTHYRASLDWSDKLLDQMADTWRYWSGLVNGIEESHSFYGRMGSLLDPLTQDLNTPAMFANMHEYANTGRIYDLYWLMSWMGIDTEWEEFSPDFRRHIDQIIHTRTQARDQKQYARSDQIRDDMDRWGIQLLDLPGGMSWRANGVVDQKKVLAYNPK